MLKGVTSTLRLYWMVFILIFVAACSVQNEKVSTSTPTNLLPTETIQLSASPIPQPSLTPTEIVVPKTPTEVPVKQVCSPFEGIALSELPETVVNPYHPPPSGSDDPHQGVDFAYRLNGDSIALEGLPVGAVLEGEVVTVLNDRFPYGNAIMIETSLDDLAGDSIAQLQIPTPAPTRSPHPALTCPMEDLSSAWHAEKRSLYLLYAHLQEPVPYKTGEKIVCGQMLGATGSTGNALNPHLHLEVRVGPSGAQFPSMAHYDTSATEDEMAYYCTWRVSELFQLLDPMRLLDSNPLHED